MPTCCLCKICALQNDYFLTSSNAKKKKSFRAGRLLSIFYDILNTIARFSFSSAKHPNFNDRQIRIKHTQTLSFDIVRIPSPIKSTNIPNSRLTCRILKANAFICLVTYCSVYSNIRAPDFFFIKR